MSDLTAAKAAAKKSFDLIKEGYPKILTILGLEDHQTLYRTYIHGVMKATLTAGYDDEYEKTYLLNMLKDEIGLSTDDLAAEILKYASEK